MKNREAIEYLNDVRNGIHIPAPGIELPLLNDKEKEAIDLAISALEKQEPMKPLPQEMDIDGRAITPCGFCGEELPHNSLYDFCPYCGQAIERRKNG